MDTVQLESTHTGQVFKVFTSSRCFGSVRGISRLCMSVFLCMYVYKCRYGKKHSHLITLNLHVVTLNTIYVLST